MKSALIDVLSRLESAKIDSLTMLA